MVKAVSNGKGRASVLTVVVFSVALAASAADWDLPWKKIESYTGRTAAVTKTATSATSADVRVQTWAESLMGALDTYGVGLLLLLR